MIPLASRGQLLVLFLALVSPCFADEPNRPESPLIRLLKKAPAERQGPVITRIGQIGTADDLAYLLRESARPDGFSPPVRLKALDALVDAALTRKVKPEGSLDALGSILSPRSGTPDPAIRLTAIRLAGLWKAESLVPALAELAASPSTGENARAESLDALAAIGRSGRPGIESVMANSTSKTARTQAIAALARLDPNAAAAKAVEAIRDADKGQDFTSLMAAFLNRQGGGDLLARSIGTQKIPADNAKLALRAVYALGRADAALVASLSKSAGIDAEVKAPTKEEMDRLVAEVASKGNAARGERTFRRADLSCMKCHAVSGAAGGVGPELSSVGQSSPVDYVIYSILLPDQSIKEQYHTLVVATNDGQVYTGIVADKDEKRIVLREATGELRTVPTSEIDESKPGGSLMPKGLSNLLTRDEFLDLVKYVSELGKPGPYALHATPTIQRWRLMKPVPEELGKEVPDVGTFVAKVRDSEPSAWIPAYALTSGELPLDEFAATSASRVLYLRGEIDVTAAGKIAIDLGTDRGVTAWLDDTGAAPSGRALIWDVTPGRHVLTLRVDTREAKAASIVVRLTKPPGSTAEFTVVGGR